MEGGIGGYISVQFEGDFEGLAEVLGLERSDGLDIRRCYLDYLEPFVSNYKAARSSNPTRGYEDEGIRRFEDYYEDGNEDGSTAAKEKGRVEHFGITLEKEEEGKCDATAHQDKEDVVRIKCYLCQRTGHFDDDTKTTQKQEKETAAAILSLPEPKVSIKYPEFIHFRTRGIIDRTDKGLWDDFWYISNTSNKHMTVDLKFFLNLKEEFAVEPLEEQGKFLFTYGIGEVLIENGDRTYTIPGVHYAPEVTLNILSLGLLRQQGFEISSNGDRCTLAYMFKDRRGKNINLDRMREQHNNYLEDYSKSLGEYLVSPAMGADFVMYTAKIEVVFLIWGNLQASSYQTQDEDNLIPLSGFGEGKKMHMSF
nr:ARID DNA-binding domain-containing protein [Tanacetum cinerariifolium]